MQKQLDQVGEFHSRIGAVIADSPRLLPHDSELAGDMAGMVRALHASIDRRAGADDDLAKRTLMALEELAEWIEAHVAGDLTAAADAWADRSYLLFGDAVATGLPVEAVFEAVHRSNMTKSMANPATGKAIKSERYLAPAIDIPGTVDGTVDVGDVLGPGATATRLGNDG